eukprot:CAMPEP_0196760936 /NCGR_PEP_ID=MMETSP1091-20130531/105490_1 /TAXON_ID=302021 /ORGANISM="Rhodomonas sp., Strain CCMP768" /LENGTH=298 /DNA_ID=CAMNT_0042109867 /DNA_START=527 /DNA_END=1421 /DNA_ORIENTATION=+
MLEKQQDVLLASFPPSLPPLRRQKFVELVRSERAEDAVAYARKHLAPMARGPALLQVKRPKPSLARALHALCPQANPQPTPSVAVATLCRFVFKRHSQAGAVVRPCHGAAAGRLCNECAAGAVAPLALALRGPHLPQVSNMPGGAERQQPVSCLPPDTRTDRLLPPLRAPHALCAGVWHHRQANRRRQSTVGVAQRPSVLITGHAGPGGSQYGKDCVPANQGGIRAGRVAEGIHFMMLGSIRRERGEGMVTSERVQFDGQHLSTTCLSHPVHVDKSEWTGGVGGVVARYYPATIKALG